MKMPARYAFPHARPQIAKVEFHVMVKRPGQDCLAAVWGTKAGASGDCNRRNRRAALDATRVIALGQTPLEYYVKRVETPLVESE